MRNEVIDMVRRPTREQLADHYRHTWLADRELAERVICRPHGLGGCGAPIGATCTNLHTGRPLEGQPAHLCRIRDAAATATAASSRRPAA